MASSAGQRPCIASGDRVKIEGITDAGYLDEFVNDGSVGYRRLDLQTKQVGMLAKGILLLCSSRRSEQPPSEPIRLPFRRTNRSDCSRLSITRHSRRKLLLLIEFSKATDWKLVKHYRLRVIGIRLDSRQRFRGSGANRIVSSCLQDVRERPRGAARDQFPDKHTPHRTD